MPATNVPHSVLIIDIIILYIDKIILILSLCDRRNFIKFLFLFDLYKVRLIGRQSGCFSAESVIFETYGIR